MRGTGHFIYFSWSHKLVQYLGLLAQACRQGGGLPDLPVELPAVPGLKECTWSKLMLKASALGAAYLKLKDATNAL